jgi:hypothetical protein
VAQVGATNELVLEVSEVDGAIFLLLDENDLGPTFPPGQEVGVVLEEAGKDNDPEIGQPWTKFS